MAMVELTRFHDPQEGWITAGAMNAAGIPAACHIGGYGSVDFTMRLATHGFPLWVEHEHLQEARAFLAEHRPPNPEAMDWKQHPEVLSGIPLAALAALNPPTGWMIAAARQRPTAFRVVVAIIATALVFGSFAGLMLLSRQPSYDYEGY